MSEKEPYYAIRKIGAIKKTYRHAKRYRQILTVFLKYGFADLVQQLHIENVVDFGLQLTNQQQWEELENLERPQRIRMALEELGPAFVKFGQVLSTHHEIVPEAYIKELEKLQDTVPPFEYERVVATIEHELRQPMPELFEHFEPIPLAAASIGQVHRARLHGGEEVVVKVQRPNIRHLVEVDLEIMFHMADLIERHMENWRTQKPRKIVKEFARIIFKEIDYTIEASHQKQFAAQFQDEEYLYVPKIHEEYSTSRVLTMEYIKGVKPSSSAVLEENGLDPVCVAKRGFDLILHQIFTHGFFHADPHPANYLILEDNYICYLDFGMMGRLVQRERERFADLVHAIAKQDERRAATAAMTLTEWEEEPDREALQRDLNDFISRHFNKPLKEMQLGKLLHDIVNILADFKMRLPRDLLLVIKALTTSEGVGRSLDPDFDPIALAEPFVHKLQRDRLTPKRLIHEAKEGWTNLVWLLLDLPEEFRSIIGMVKRGQLKMDVQVQGIDPIRETLDKVSNRLTLAILVAALVIGSSIMVHSGIPPKWNEIPVIGVLGFLLAGLVSVFIIVSILKQRRH